MPSTFFGWVGFLLKQYGGLFLSGTCTTLLIALTGTLFGFAIGLLVAIVRTIEIPRGMGPVKRAIRKLAHILIGVYIQIFRGKENYIDNSK